MTCSEIARFFSFLTQTLYFYFFLDTYIGSCKLLSLALPRCHKAPGTMVLPWYLCFLLCQCGCWLLLPIPLSQTAFCLILSLVGISLVGEFCSATDVSYRLLLSASSSICLWCSFYLIGSTSSWIVVWGYSHLLAFVKEEYMFLGFVFLVVSKLFLRREGHLIVLF